MGFVIRVLIVERETPFRDGLVVCLSSLPDMQVVGCVATANEGCDLAREHYPHVVVVGTSLLDAPEMEAAKIFRRGFPAIAAIVTSDLEKDDELVAALHAGASAYCGHTIDEATLVRYIRRSATGASFINKQIQDRPDLMVRIEESYRARMREESVPGSLFALLNDRELEILRQMRAGLTNAEIADVLGLSRGTVKSSIVSILRKLDLDTRDDAVSVLEKREWLYDERVGLRGDNAERASRETVELLSWFTPPARESLLAAENEARRLGQNHVGTEHQLVGLLTHDTSVAASVLLECGINRERVRRAIALAVGSPAMAVQQEKVPWTPRLREAIRVSIEAARRLGHAEIGTGHLLLGLAKERRGTAAGILESLGCRLEDLERRTTELLVGGAVDEPEEEAGGEPLTST
jgi:ATP-dependent Clp protease ATP-binding subunit ClpC